MSTKISGLTERLQTNINGEEFFPIIDSTNSQYHTYKIKLDTLFQSGQGYEKVTNLALTSNNNTQFVLTYTKEDNTTDVLTIPKYFIEDNDVAFSHIDPTGYITSTQKISNNNFDDKLATAKSVDQHIDHRLYGTGLYDDEIKAYFGDSSTSRSGTHVLADFRLNTEVASDFAALKDGVSTRHDTLKKIEVEIDALNASNATKIGIDQVNTSHFKINSSNLSTRLNIKDLGITTNLLNHQAVTRDKLANNAVETSKIKTGAVIADKLSTDAVETSKIKNNAVTPAKISSGGPSWDSSTVRIPGHLSVTSGVEAAGRFRSHGTDFHLYNAGRSKGNVHQGRALVHGSGDELAINYGGDYTGGVTIKGIVTVPDLSVQKIKSNGDNTVVTKAYVDDADIRIRPLDSSRVSDDCILLRHMSDNSVGTAEILDDSITSAKIENIGPQWDSNGSVTIQNDLDANGLNFEIGNSSSTSNNPTIVKLISSKSTNGFAAIKRNSGNSGTLIFDNKGSGTHEFQINGSKKFEVRSGRSIVHGGFTVTGSGTTTIGGSNFSNPAFLVGSDSYGIAIDNNEIYQKGNNLNIGVVAESQNIYFKSSLGTLLTIHGNGSNVWMRNGITSNSGIFRQNYDNQRTHILGGTSNTKGADIELYGINTNHPGYAYYDADRHTFRSNNHKRTLLTIDSVANNVTLHYEGTSAKHLVTKGYVDANTFPKITSIDDITNRLNSGFYETKNADTANGWPESTGTWYHMLSNTHSNTANYNALQFAADYYKQKVFFRSTNNDGKQGWSELWHTNNMGSGSGLDADTVDGKDASDFATSNHNHDSRYLRTGAAGTATRLITFTGGLASTNVGTTPDKIGNIAIRRKNYNINNLESFILSKTDSGFSGSRPAGTHNGFGVISLRTHANGGTDGDRSYFTQLGLDTNQNNLWIRSANASTSFNSWNKIWHDGNDGSGSGLDADKLAGVASTSYATKTYSDGRYIQKTGTQTLDGTLNFNKTNQGLVWGMNSDGASIRFHNTSDGDTNSRLEFNTRDNYSEEFLFSHTAYRGSGVPSEHYEWLRIGHNKLLHMGHKVWHEGNDGTGSGLDADTVDGKHASDFATATHNHDDIYVKKGVTITPSDLSSGGPIWDTNSNLTVNGSLTVGNNAGEGITTRKIVGVGDSLMLHGGSQTNAAKIELYSDNSSSLAKHIRLRGLTTQIYSQSNLALDIKSDGQIVAPQQTKARINTNKALTTKEWVLSEIANVYPDDNYVLRDDPEFVSGVIINGSLDDADYTRYSGGLKPGEHGSFKKDGVNLLLKGNANGVSGVYFESEKDGTRINSGSDYGFIQYHAYGIGNSSGEKSDLVIGVANDGSAVHEDKIIFDVPNKDHLKVIIQNNTSTEYKVWHEGNDGATSGLDADKLDGIHASSFFNKTSTSQQNIKGDTRFDQGKRISFGHTNQVNNDDGGISAGRHGSGLNIVGVRTKTDEDRIIRTWGSLITSNNQTYWHSGNDGKDSTLDAGYLGGQKHDKYLLKTDKAADSSKLGGTAASNYVTRSNAHFITTNNTTPVIISRHGHTKESVKIGLNDQSYIFNYTNDENWNQYVFEFNNTDTEGEGGARANTGKVWFRSKKDYIDSSDKSKGVGPHTVEGYIRDSRSGTPRDYKIWHSGNDGSGSGLDADTLDGIHASSFAKINTRIPVSTPTSDNHAATKKYVDDRVFDDAQTLDGIDSKGFYNNTSQEIPSGSSGSLPTGWYTIAYNHGDRAIARFGVRDVAGGRHQSIIFTASHTFGTNNSNNITITHNSHYANQPIKGIRIKEGSTYDGAALQIYIANASNSVKAYILGDNFQSYGWVKAHKWVPDNTNPGIGAERRDPSTGNRTQTSYYSSGGTTLNNARLYEKPGWAPSDTSKLITAGITVIPNNRDYAQLDLGTVKTVKGVGTRGREDVDQWVTKYQVAYSSNGSSWTFAQQAGASNNVFTGNSNRNSLIVRYFSQSVQARFIRIYPINNEFNGFPVLRFAAYIDVWPELTNIAADLDLSNSNGGIITTDEIYAGGTTDQYKVWHDGNTKDAIVEDKIKNGAVTTTKLSTGAPTWNSASDLFVEGALRLGDTSGKDSVIPYTSISAKRDSSSTDTLKLLGDDKIEFSTRFYDEYPRMIINRGGNITLPARDDTTKGHSKLHIEDKAVPLSFKETDETGAGSLWRMPLDGKALRFDASQNGTNFSGYKDILTLKADGKIVAPNLLKENITDAKSLVTKEYVDNKLTSNVSNPSYSGNQAITGRTTIRTGIALQCQMAHFDASKKYTTNSTMRGSPNINPTMIDVLNIKMTPRDGSSCFKIEAMINFENTHYSENLVFRLYRRVGEGASRGDWEHIGGYNPAHEGKNSNTMANMFGMATAFYDNNENSTMNNVKLQFIDDPSTTDVVEYAVGFITNTSLYFYLNRVVSTNASGSYERASSNMIVTELAGA